MFHWLRDRLCEVLRVPPRPHPPRGSEGTLQVFRAAEAYYAYRLLGWALKFGASVAVLVVVIAVEGRLVEAAAGDLGGLAVLVTSAFILVKLLVVVQGLVSFLALRLDFELRWYMVTDVSLRIREGIWTVHEMTMTLANIQNIVLSQGPIQRLLGIADLEVKSAGGGGPTTAEARHGLGSAAMHTGRFRGIDDAEAVRDLMLARLRSAQGTGVGDEDRVAGQAAATAAPSAPTLPPAAVSALREILAAARALRQSASALTAGGSTTTPGPGAPPA